MAKSMPDKDDMTVPGADLPPRFDPAWYLSANPDLTIGADAAADHYAATGRNEGRVASPLALREHLIGLIDDGRSVLEIGPFCNPLLRGPNIAYLDVLDAQQLRARAIEIGIDPAGCPERIDYVGGIDRVRRRFDAVISSHAIEHQPDLIHHFQQVERILAADGLFCLIIPDKRYCFDHYIAESTIADVIEAHREQRRRHSLASVIEHVALTTHNDSHRHWAGDHGPAVPPDRAVRVENAVRDHDFNPGRYIDVHAWYFTPDSFRTIVETLSAMGLIGLELAGVYDTARNRNEFCAVLRLDPAARARLRDADADNGDGDAPLILQTADADRYAPMLAITATNVREYCRRQGFAYESFLGIKRGFHPWQATFNRIPMLEELVARGFAGWVVYLDADAYIQDLDFDLTAYLADKQDRAAILATSGVSGEHWDINAGVALINLGHPLGRALVEQWAAGFAAHSDETLRNASEWMGPGNDQDLLHQILQRDAVIADAVLVEPMAFINGPHASFIRQHLRTMTSTFDARLEALAQAVSDVMRRGGQVAPVARASEADQRWISRFAHPDGRSPALVEASTAAPLPDIAARMMVGFAAADSGQDSLPAHLLAFANQLRAGDAGAVAAELAALGKAKTAQGFLGGSRQHERAHNAQFADRLARWTYDKLVSLAEAVGVLRLENPENGPWGFNALTDPVELFRQIEEALGGDLSPPASIGGHLGIAVGRGMVLHMRMLDAIHAAWRLRQMADIIGLGSDVRIAEIGGGAALTAFYARRLGLTRYRLFDTPVMGAIQGYVLAGSGQGISLAGEAEQSVALLPGSGFAALEPGSVDLLFNTDSLPELGAEAGQAYLRHAERIGIRYILSINQEAILPGQSSASEMIAEAGGYRLAARHRHWLRAGYTEEHYVRS